MNLIKRVKQFLNEGQARTTKAKKNVILSILFKGSGIIIGFAYFPLSLGYLGAVKFGIYLTLISMIDWFLDMDVGIGQGLRNKFGEAVAEDNDKKAVNYVSTAYFALGGIIIIVATFLIIGSLFIPWVDWLNASKDLEGQIRLLVVIIIAAFAIRFIAGYINEIFYALQKSAYVEFFGLLKKAFFLILIIVITQFSAGSLILFGSANSLTFALVPLLAGVYFFRTKMKQYTPSLKAVRIEYIKELFSIGIKFFAIRVSMIVIHQTNNFLIAGFVSLDGVTQYEATYKYLSIFLMLFVILTNQLWPANIEAYKQGDLAWMKKSMWLVFKIWLGTIVIAAAMVASSPIVYKYWLGEKLHIPILISVSVAFSICTTTWVNMFNLVLNGTGRITLQMYAWIFAACVNIPASIFFVKVLDYGVMGIVFGTIASLVPVAIVSPIQVMKILAGKEKGVWAK